MRARDDVVYREEEDGAFLFDPDTGRVCYLNELGRCVWQLLASSSDPQEITGKVCAHYSDQAEAKVTEDCEKFFAELRRFGFVAEPE